MDLLIPPGQQDAYAAMTDPLNFPTEYLGWLDDRIKQLAIQQVPKSSVGDYKVSAQTADHTDSAGGTWLICDGTSIDASLTALIALVGSTRPDAQGRALVMKGTHTSVNAILKTEGVALANRSPQHNGTVTGAAIAAALAISPNPHSHSIDFASGGATGSTGHLGSSGSNDHTDAGAAQNVSLSVTGSGTVSTGPGGTLPVDTPAFIVPGNLFIHT